MHFIPFSGYRAIEQEVEYGVVNVNSIVTEIPNEYRFVRGDVLINEIHHRSLIIMSSAAVCVSEAPSDVFDSC